MMRKRRIGSGGIPFENVVARVLRESDYDVVRSAGSHGAIDLMANRRGEVLYVQAKRRGIADIRIADWNHLFLRAQQQQARPLLAIAGTRTTDVMFLEITGTRIARTPAPWTAWEPFDPAWCGGDDDRGLTCGGPRED